MIERISNEELEIYAQKVKDDIKYGGEGILIDEALKQHPLNVDKAVVAMKICLIDITMPMQRRMQHQKTQWMF